MQWEVTSLYLAIVCSVHALVLSLYIDSCIYVWVCVYAFTLLFVPASVCRTSKTWISHSSLQRKKKAGVYASRAMLGDLLRKKHTERRRPFAQSRKILCQTFKYRPRCAVFLEGSAELRYFRILLMATMKKHDTNVDPREKGRKKEEQEKEKKWGNKGKKKRERKERNANPRLRNSFSPPRGRGRN